MRLYLVFLFVLGNILLAEGQNSSGSLITLGIKKIENHDKLNASQINILNNHVEYLVTANGMSGDANQENFMVVPTLNVIQSQVVTSTLQPVHQVTCMFMLTAKETLSGKAFSSMSRKVVSGGVTEEVAMNNALINVDPESGDVREFFLKTRQGIINYYENNCQNLLAKANTQHQARKFLESIHTLYGIPPEAKSCFDQAQPLILKSFNDFQKQECGMLVQKAKAEAANFQFNNAVELIALVDPTGPCKDEARLFLKNLENKIDRENTRVWDLYNSLVELQMDANKAKFDAIKEIMRYGYARPFGTLYTTRSATFVSADESEPIGGAVVSKPIANPSRPAANKPKETTKQKPTKKANLRYDEVPKIWAVIVGVANYENNGIQDLTYTINDADALAKFLSSPAGGGLPREQITFLAGPQATRSNIIKHVNQVFGQAFETDLILFYFSGHGAPDASGKEVYFLPYDTDPSNIESSAVSQLDIQKVIGKSRAEKKIVIVDACHSGGLGTDLGKKDALGDAALINRLLQQVAYSDKSTAIFTASRASEKSEETKELGIGHGVFTYYLIEGLKGKANSNPNENNFVTISELYEYTYRKVAAFTKGRQHPELKGNFDNNLPLSIVKTEKQLPKKK